MPTNEETTNLDNMDKLDFVGWNGPDWDVFSHLHTDDVHVDFGGYVTEGLQAHVDAMKGSISSSGHTKVTSHPIRIASGEWTCVVGAIDNGARMVTVARWRDGAVAEEYIWMNSVSG
jgi:hypothetical protein